MLNKITLFFLFTFSFLYAQQNNSFFFIPVPEGSNGDYVECTVDQSSGASENLEPTTGMTLEFWVQQSFVVEPDNYVGIVNYMTLAGTGPNDEAGFAFIYFNGMWRFIVCVANEADIFGAGLQNWPGVELEFDEWVHIAASYDGTDVKIYKNGVLSQTHSTGGGAIKWTAINKKLDISKGIVYGGTPTDKYFEGAIDEVRVWSIAQTQAEIQTNMNQVIGAEIGLEAYWNFNDNQSTSVQDQTGNGYPGTLNQNGTGFWFDDIFAGGDPTGACCDDAGGDCEENTEGECTANGGTWLGQGTTCDPNPCVTGPCFDTEITAANFPYNHLSDLSTEDNDWDMNTFTFPSGGEHSNGADGNDYTYKLTLTEAAKIYVTTCDLQTTVDVQIAIYTEDCNEASWIMFQDDSNTPIFYPDETTKQYDFACASGFGSPEYANMLPGLQLEAGTYYLVVDDRNGGNGTVRTWIGYSLELDSSYFEGDNSSLELFFNDEIYGGEYPGGSALDTEDFKDTLTVQDNATGSVINSVTDLTGGSLSGGETSFKLNLEFDANPSGAEILQMGPKDEKSIFNNIGVPLINTDAMYFSLSDQLAPYINNTDPESNELDVDDDSVIEIHLNEPVVKADSTALNSANITDHFSITDLTDNQSLSYNADISNGKDFILTPTENFLGYHEIEVKIEGDLKDSVGFSFPTSSFSFTIKDNIPPTLDASSISNDNSSIELTMNEGVYTNNDGTGGLNENDFNIDFIQNSGNTSTASIESITASNGAILSGGELNIKVNITYDDFPSGVETIQLTPSSNIAIYDLAGNALSSSQTSSIFTLSDQLAPTVSIDPQDGSEGIFESADITFSFSESVRFLDNSVMTNSTIQSLISLKETDSGGSNIAYSSLVSGNNKDITITPVSNFDYYQLVYVSLAVGLEDEANNPTSNIESTFRVRDPFPPTIQQSTLAVNNDYVDLSFSELVYGNNDGSGSVSITDFTLTLNQNNGNVSTVTISSLTDTSGNQLSGGDDLIRLHLSMNGSASGVETIEINPVDANSVFDLAGNALQLQATPITITLNDELIPTVDTLSISNSTTINLNTENSIRFTFSEPLSFIEYSVKARQYSNMTFTADTTNTELTIHLTPPLKALDTIDIDILEIIDNAGHSTVNLYYEYYTPALGDYDWNDTIDVNDLTDFISGWKSKNYAYELGPVKGKIPHYLPEFDSEFELEDGMVFVQMWGWAQSNFGFGVMNKPSIGEQPSWLKKSVIIPAGTMSGQIYVNYDPSAGRIEITPPSYGANGLALTHHDSETGRMIIEFGRFTDEIAEKTFSIIPYMDQSSHFSITHIFYDKHRETISSGTQRLNVLTPNEFKLYPNYPNPFNPITTINYAISEVGNISMDIFDVNGRWVSNLIQTNTEPGFYDIKWNAGNYSSGIYFCRLTTEKTVLTSKLLLVK